VVEAAQRLGVSAPTLYEWRKGRTPGRPRVKPLERSQALVPVRVAERAAQTAVTGLQQVVLVSPSGWWELASVQAGRGAATTWARGEQPGRHDTRSGAALPGKEAGTWRTARRQHRSGAAPAWWAGCKTGVTRRFLLFSVAAL